MGFKKLLEKILLFEYNLVIREYTRISRIFCLANVYEFGYEFSRMIVSRIYTNIRTNFTNIRENSWVIREHS